MNDLQKKFEIVKEISCGISHTTLMEIYKSLVEGKSTIIKEKIIDFGIDRDRLLKESKLWSTYDMCRDLDLKIEKEELFAVIWIHNGSFVDGQRIDLRFNVEVKMPISHINLFEDEINQEFKEYVEYQWEISEKKRKEKWIAEFTLKILD